jgi:putative DNA primase/helicase
MTGHSDAVPIYRKAAIGHQFLWEDGEVLVRLRSDKLGRVPFEVLSSDGTRLASGMVNPWEEDALLRLGNKAGRRNGIGPDAWEFRLRQVGYRLSKVAPELGLDTEIKAGVGTITPRVLQEIEAEEVKWLWWPYIPVGKLTVIAADPGVGKTWMTLDLAARITVGGQTPDRQSVMPEGHVAILNAEDGAADTLRPRFDRQGGNPAFVHLLESVMLQDGTERMPDLVADFAQLENIVKAIKIALILIDPVNAYMGNVDSHKDADVRRVLSPLKRLSEVTGVTTLGVMHFSKGKNERSALYRVIGSIGYVAAARSVLVVGRDPQNPETRVLAPAKANLTKEGRSITFTITDEPALAWGESSDLTANDLAGPAPVERSDGPAIAEALQFLEEELADGPLDSRVVLQDAKKASISQRTLERAKEQVVKSTAHREQGKRGVQWWDWELK